MSQCGDIRFVAYDLYDMSKYSNIRSVAYESVVSQCGDIQSVAYE